MKKLFSFLLLALALAGCKEKGAKQEGTAKQETAQDDLHAVLKKFPQKRVPVQPEPVAAVVEEEPHPIPEVQFPNPAPLVREDKARRLRGWRHVKHHQQIAKAKPHDDGAILQDYQSWGYPEDRSTLPIDQSRILTADMRIPAILEDSVNSQVPGRLVAVIDRDILSPNGKKVLLPAYSKVICHYESLPDPNATRLPLQCKRIIRPDGASVMLKDAQGADQVGRSGLTGDVDHRTIERYGAAFTMGLISALAQASTSLSQNDAYSNSAEQLSNNLGQVTAKVLEQKLDLVPILTLPQGTRIQIIPLNDIVFEVPRKQEKVQ
jgi:Type IV secretory pathway, VirB10 components